MSSQRDIVLVGPMGAGKTSVGQQLAAWLGTRFDDLDLLVESREGKTVSELFSIGEPAFREAESQALSNWVTSGAKEGQRVLALGGGALVSSDSANALKDVTLVHLDATPEALAARLVGEERDARPLICDAADPVAVLTRLREARAPGYARADQRVDTSHHSTRDVAVRVLRTLSSSQADSARVSRDNVEQRRAFLPTATDTRAIVIWDGGLPGAHRDFVLPALEDRAAGLIVIDLPGGEKTKSIDVLQQIWQRLLDEKVDKDCPVWAFGGGAVTDLAGMVAHTYKRGLPLTLVPSTLLGQLDAAIGGKNGINFGGAKNMLGTIRQPDAVGLDSLYQLTLSDEHFRGGMSEAVKSALIGDPELLEQIESESSQLNTRELQTLENVTWRAASVKLGVVERDLEEAGERRHLNLGHTLAHALEAEAARTGNALSHGDAVAIGMAFVSRLSRRLNLLSDASLVSRLDDVLGRLGLPARVPAWAESVDELIGHTTQDKKRRAGKNHWVLLHEPGRVSCDVLDRDAVRDELVAFVAESRSAQAAS